MKLRNHHPPVGKGKGASLPFQISVACWIDLLGYGQQISASNFNPTHPSARAALSRIRAFHSIVAQHSARTFPTLVINDGAVAYRDLSLRHSNVTFDFLARCHRLFLAINEREAEFGFPGCRAVIAAGFRSRGSRRGRDHVTGQFQSILRRLSSGRISQLEALHEAASMERSFDVIPQLQANFAFTKAYVAEQSGKAGGLGGQKLFLDMALLNDASPTWLQLGTPINWGNEGLNLSAIFAPIEQLRSNGHPEGGPNEVRDGFGVAEAIAPDTNLKEEIRAARAKARALADPDYHLRDK